MTRASLLTCAVAAIVAAFPAPASARSCGDVAVGGKRAYSVAAHNVSCRRVHTTLKRWLRRRHLPHNPYGRSYCEIQRGHWFCALANGRYAPYFTFKLRQTASATARFCSG